MYAPVRGSICIEQSRFTECKEVKRDSITCPKCKEGVMKLPLATKPLDPGYADKRGS
jgi:hypothetical protein